ncbi:MAG: hypothetical protein H7248_07620 [Microbacteriaceae bacterium]|nr:hypothetical protein [Microbacteriaceae bacterium]
MSVIAGSLGVMELADFRIRVLETATRVEARTGIDPLDTTLSMAVTTDARLEKLPGSIGIGLGAMAIAATVSTSGLIASVRSAPNYAVLGLLVVLIVALAGGSVSCALIARAAVSRRAANNRYDDAWAQLAVEVWPAPRYRSWADGPGAASGYSRTEFLLALGRGESLENFARHCPFVRMP